MGAGAAGLRDRQLTPAVLDELRNDLPDGSPGYLRQASEQIGVAETNDFVFGSLHEALRQRLYDAVTAGDVTGAVPLDSPDLPLHLDGVPAGKEEIAKLEAPLAVQGRAPRSGFFPINKFSSVPLIMQAARAAVAEAVNDDVKKRFMIVPSCHVIRLETATTRPASVSPASSPAPARSPCPPTVAS